MKKKPKLYLDNCCFNRPFDDQSQLTVRLKTEAVLFIQNQIRAGAVDLAWSSILDFEIDRNPFESRKETIRRLREYTFMIVEVNEKIKETSLSFQSRGLKLVDSLHVACAVAMQCDFFLTTDYRILGKPIPGIALWNPIQFVQIFEKELST